jgi:thioredoxin reductase (NADPH)
MDEKIYQTAIIGMGPSGISAAIYLKRGGVNPICFEQNEIGGKLNQIKEIENYPGYLGDGKGLAEQLKEQVKHFELDVRKETVLSISKEDDKTFTVKTTADSYHFLSVIIASGIREKPYAVKGSEKYSDNGISRCAECDGPFYKGKKVAVIGSSIHAIKDASYLASIDGFVYFISPDKNILSSSEMKELSKKDNFSLLAPYTIVDSDGTKHMESLTLENSETKEIKKIDTSALFILLGSTPLSEFLGYMDVADEKGQLIADERMKTKEEGLYAVGDVRNTPLRQVITAVADGGLAAINVRSYLAALKQQKE